MASERRSEEAEVADQTVRYPELSCEVCQLFQPHMRPGKNSDGTFQCCECGTERKAP